MLSGIRPQARPPSPAAEELDLATIRDVAKAAGVSIATVSRVFNNSALVTRETAERVWRVANELDYWPNSAAMSLTTNRTRTLGVLLPDLYGEFFSEIIRGIDDRARRDGYQILVSGFHDDPGSVLDIARSMLGRVDGLTMLVPDDSVEVVAKIRRRLPVVLLNPREDQYQCSSVRLDNRAGGLAMVEHLIALGHSDVAIVTGPETNVDADERLLGYREALLAAGLRPDPSREIPGDFREFSGFKAADALLALSPRPTAVFATNDNMAVGLISALTAAGVRVGVDMAVTGFDDITIARYLRPALTTIHVDAFGMGRAGAELLLAEIRTEDDVVPSHVIMPAELVVRESCGAEPAGALDDRGRSAAG